MVVTSKFKCVLVVNEEYGDGQNVTFNAVYSSDPEHENYKWSSATPYGMIVMSITNPNLKDHFKAGKEYIVTLEEV